MRATLYGYRRVDMTDDNGRSINGYSCYIGFISQGVDGEETAKVFVGDPLARDCKFVPKAKGKIVVEFNQKGKICGIMNAD